MDILHAKIIAALSLCDLLPGASVFPFLLPLGVRRTPEGKDIEPEFLFDPLVETGYLTRRYFILVQDEDMCFVDGPEIPPSEVRWTELVSTAYFVTDQIPQFALVAGSKVIPQGVWVSLP